MEDERSHISGILSLMAARRWLTVAISAAVAVGACGGRIDGSSNDGGTDGAVSGFSTTYYFYCVVEPQVLMGGISGTPCGSGNGCHYNPSSVSSMVLAPLPAPVSCSGSGVNAVPTETSQIAPGTAPQQNFMSVTSELSPNFQQSMLYQVVSGTTPNHPITYSGAEASAMAAIVKTWATGSP